MSQACGNTCRSDRNLSLGGSMLFEDEKAHTKDHIGGC